MSQFPNKISAALTYEFAAWFTYFRAAKVTTALPSFRTRIKHVHACMQSTIESNTWTFTQSTTHASCVKDTKSPLEAVPYFRHLITWMHFLASWTSFLPTVHKLTYRYFATLSADGTHTFCNASKNSFEWIQGNLIDAAPCTVLQCTFP